jgi:hypothetical protein
MWRRNRERKAQASQQQALLGTKRARLVLPGEDGFWVW